MREVGKVYRLDDGGEGGKERMEGGVKAVRRKKGCLIRRA